MAQRIKATRANIINLWFGADTLLRQQKIAFNPELWEACVQVSRTFVPPSGASTVEQYRKSDKVSFARAVQQELELHQFELV